MQESTEHRLVASLNFVDHPPHYTDGKYEVIDILQDKLTKEEFKGFLKGNVLKYTLRAGKKDDEQQDLKKASWYADRLAKID